MISELQSKLNKQAVNNTETSSKPKVSINNDLENEFRDFLVAKLSADLTQLCKNGFIQTSTYSKISNVLSEENIQVCNIGKHFIYHNLIIEIR
jgi:hypothetical protein